MRQPHMLQTLITAHLIAASPAATAPTGGAAGHAGTSSAAGGTPRRPAEPHTTGPSGLDSPPATARPESLHQARVDGPPHVHVRGHGASRLGAQRPQASTPGLSCGQAPERQAPAATAAAAQTSAPISVSRREALTTAAAQALPPSPSGAAGKAHSVSSTDSGDERPAKAARQREADAPGTAGAANAAATANTVAGAEEVDVRRMFGSQDTEEGQDESPGGSQQEEPEGLEQQQQQQQQQPGQRQQAQLHSTASKGRRSSGGGAGGGGAGADCGNENGGGHGGQQQSTPGGGDVEDGDVGDAHSEGGGGLVTDLGEDEEDLLCSQWQEQHSSPDRRPARQPGLAGGTDADDVGAEEAAAQGARPVAAAARRRPQRLAAQKANQKMGDQRRDPQLTDAAAGAQPGPQARRRPAAGSSLDDGGQATDSPSGSEEAQGMEGAQEHEQLPPPPLQRDPRRPGYAPLLAALQHRAAAQRAARQGQQLPEAAAAEEGSGSSAWGVKLLGERRAVMNMVMGGDLAVLVGAALKDMTEKRLWTLPRRPVAHSSHCPVPLLDGNFSDTVLNKREAAEAKKAVLAQLTRKLRVAVHQRLRAEDPNFAGRPEGLTDAQIAANLPEYLPPSSKVVMSVIGRGPHPSVFDDEPALRGEDTLRVRSGCELQPYEVVGLYSGEAFLYEDWEALTNADPEPGSHFSSLFARKHEFGRYAADARLPAPVVARLGELLDPELAGRLGHTEAARKFYVSAARLGCPVSAVNDPRRDVNACRPDFRATPNVAVEVVDLLGCLPLMVMFTLRRVPGDQELLYDYGDDYWRLHREESRAAAEADASAQLLEAEREARQRVEARARELEAALQTEREQRVAEQARAEADREQARRLEQALEEARAEALRLRGLAGGQGLMLANANAHVMDLEQQLVNLQEQRRLSQQEPQRQQQQQQQQQELGPHKPQASTPLPAPMVRCEIHNDSAAPAAAMGSAAVGPEKEPEEEVEEEVMEEVDVVVAADQQTPPQTPPHPLGEALSPRDDGLAVPAPAAEAETGGVDVGTAANEEPVTEAAAEAAAEAVAEVEAQAEAEAAAEAVAEAEAEEDLAVLDREAAATSAGGSPAAGTSGAAVGLASSTGAGLPPSPTVTELLASIGAHCDATNDAFRAIGLPGHADTSPAAAAARADGRGLYSGTAAAGVPAASARNGCFIAAAAARADAATAGPTSSGAAHAGAGSGAAEPGPSRDRHAAPGMALVDTQAEQTQGEVQLQEQATQEPRNSRKRPREAGERHRDRVKAEHIGKLSLRSSHRTKAVARATKAAEQATAAAEAARAAAAAAVKAATACVEEVAVERAAEALQCADEARQYGDEAVAAAEAAMRTASHEAEEARAQAHKAVLAAGQAGQAQAAAEAAARAAMVAARAPAVAAATVKTDPSAQAAIVANRAASAAATEVIDLTMDEDD